MREGAAVAKGDELGEGVGAFGAPDEGGVADLLAEGEAGACCCCCGGAGEGWEEHCRGLLCCEVSVWMVSDVVGSDGRVPMTYVMRRGVCSEVIECK